MAKLTLTLVKPTADGLAALYKKLTGKEPDLAKIQAELAKHPPDKPAS